MLVLVHDQVVSPFGEGTRICSSERVSTGSSNVAGAGNVVDGHWPGLYSRSRIFENLERALKFFSKSQYYFKN